MTDIDIVEILPPMHPGEVLREEFLKPMNLTASGVARACKIPRARVERVARGELGVSADTALRLGRFFGTEPQFWLNLQADYDLRRAAATVDLEDVEVLHQAA